jgi:catechol 2,3-dioxygenase-like lactoylglutathione lyase family enzyme
MEIAREDVMAKRLASLVAIATAVAAITALAASEVKVVTPQDAAEARIAEVKIKVADLDRSAEFYRRVFQMQEIQRIGGAGDAIQEVALKFGATLDKAKAGDHTGIVLVFRPGLAAPYKATDDVPATVLTVPDVAATMKRAAEAGIPPTGKATEAKGYSVGTVNDPSGNVIELIHLN